jgi:TolB protein
VYAVNEVTRQSLWVRQVATNSHAQIANRAEVNYFWLEFSKDGNYILYVMATGNNPPALYQMPVLGGTSRKLLEDLTGPIGLSPDGKQFAFIRRSPEGEVALMVANAFDKDGERKLVTRRVPNFLFNPAWSPDGRSIACLSVSITAEGNQTSLIEVRVEDGAEKMLTPSRWKFGRQALWIPDGSGLLMIASEGPYGPYQIWHISYPDGAARRVTNDLNNYGYASLTSDSGALVTVLHDVHPLVWVVPKDQPSLARQVTSGPGTSNDYWGLSWTPDGRIIYGSMASGHQELWVMNADGSDQKQLTADARSNFDPTVSPDGRQIVFSSNRAGSRKIWRMDIDGNNLKQLTDGSSEDYLPYYAPDGRSVVYTADDGQKLTIWKVSSEGGEPQRLTDRGSGWPAVSPDGKLVACWYANESAGRTELAIIPVDGGQPIKLFEVSSTVNLWAEIRWSPDGKELIYIDRRGDVSNLWAQSLEGGAPKQMTDFKEDQLFRFDWSRDGKRLVCSRGVESNDLVLIANSR